MVIDEFSISSLDTRFASIFKGRGLWKTCGGATVSRRYAAGLRAAHMRTCAHVTARFGPALVSRTRKEIAIAIVLLRGKRSRVW